MSFPAVLSFEIFVLDSGMLLVRRSDGVILWEYSEVLREALVISEGLLEDLEKVLSEVLLEDTIFGRVFCFKRGEACADVLTL
eukprot:CAMPEP_0117887192 /NCGR_PEP_ID=MMETSP0950-20121206/20918_1 /TAXON_ID=44440 /ORGANISM="Chattonella subsalsa, Strain CCMP2191" /LENGTH=82 /DNA_ID=CAMNT_0005744881 /DNA_START=264 /DNA_END=508 /DNA_ORIENTATION=+